MLMSISGYFLIGEMVKAIPSYSNANEALMRRAFPNELMLKCRYLNVIFGVSMFVVWLKR